MSVSEKSCMMEASGERCAGLFHKDAIWRPALEQQHCYSSAQGGDSSGVRTTQHKWHDAQLRGNNPSMPRQGGLCLGLIIV